MCVIITRQAGSELIDFKDLEAACHVNSDGWGLAVSVDGKIEYRKGMKNDPDYIMRRLEEVKDHNLLLHLRFVTKGPKNLDNCHPFVTLQNDADGIDMCFAHNGTLYKYGNKDYSDSCCFNEKFVKPLMKRSWAYTGEDWTKDEFAQELLKDQIAGSSIFVLMDGRGEFSYTNKSANGSKDHGHFWSSNVYSFERSHREKGYVYNTNQSNSSCSTNFAQNYNDIDWDVACEWGQEEWDAYDQALMKDKENNILPFQPDEKKIILDVNYKEIQGPTNKPNLPVVVRGVNSDQPITQQAGTPPVITSKDAEISKFTQPERYLEKRLKEDGKKIKSMMDDMKHIQAPSVDFIQQVTSKKRISFEEATGVNLKDVTKWDEETFEELHLNFPDLAITLTMDLCHALYCRTKNVETFIAARKGNQATQ